MKTKLFKNKITNFFCSLLFIMTIAVCVSSCDSFVELEIPKSQLTNSATFENYSTANAALADIYIKLRDQGILSGTASGLSNQLANYTDELACYAAPGDPSLPFFTNMLLASNTTVSEYWNVSYNQIYAANAVIEGVEQSSRLNEKEKKALKGEALFIRALVHFYLMGLYGDIPFVTSTDYKVNSVVKKITTVELYPRIIADLKESIDLLEPTYKNAERIRPNKLVAEALLARVYLYNKSWAEAENLASEVIGKTSLYVIEENLSLVFLKDSKETIWQLQPSVPGKNTDEAGIFIFFSGPPPFVAMTENLIKSFAADDLRKSNWTASVTDGISTWYHPYKYKSFDYTPSSVEYSVVFRLAEQYLIRAEARVQRGDLDNARKDLNKIRKRAGLNETVATSQDELLNAILQERKWELFTEYGHRFFDLKRSGKIDAVLTAAKPGWNSSDALFPIPQNELSLNPGLRPQNKNY